MSQLPRVVQWLTLRTAYFMKVAIQLVQNSLCSYNSALNGGPSSYFSLKNDVLQTSLFTTLKNAKDARITCQVFATAISCIARLLEYLKTKTTSGSLHFYNFQRIMRVKSDRAYVAGHVLMAAMV